MNEEEDNKEIWYSYGVLLKMPESRIKELKKLLYDNGYIILYDKVSITDLRLIQRNLPPIQEVVDAEEQ